MRTIISIVCLFLGFIISTVANGAEPSHVCKAASTVLKDMRYAGGDRTKREAPGDFSHPRVRARLRRCERIAGLARPFGEDLQALAVVVAYGETNFRPGVAGKKSEEGIMQVLAKHHCRGVEDLDDGQGGCTDPDRAGVRALRLFYANAKGRRRDRIMRALRLYNGSSAYAAKRFGWWKAVKRALSGPIASSP